MAPLHTATELMRGHRLTGRMTLAEKLTPAGAQKDTLIALGVFIVGITVLWVIPLLKYALYPWKIWTVTTHEFCHAAAGCCTGARVLSIEVDPDEGGVTHMKGGATCWTLPAGYLGSSFIGALLVFAGFDSRASKVASIFVGVIMLITLWWAKKNWFTLLSTLFAAGLMVAFWFIDHGTPLRFYMLFVGTMSSLYALYDVLDDLILRKVNESDASQFAKHFGGSARAWGVLWLLIALLFFAAGILAGLATWKDTAAEMAADSAKFLPTR